MARIAAWNRSVLLLALAVAVYFQTWSDLWRYWENKLAPHTHGTLIAVIAIWLVWQARSALSEVTPAASRAALPVVLLLSAAWFVAARANLFLVHAMLWPLLAFAVLWAGVGWRVASRFAFPLGLLYFSFPLWDYFKPPLQAVAAFMVGLLTRATGVPVYVEGTYVMLPDTTIFIAQDCSGAQFLSVALAVGALAVKFRGDRFRTGVLVMALAGLLSMAFNWLRILLIVLAYLRPELRHRMESMGHLNFGWWIFALDLVAFYLLLRFIPSPEREPDAQPVAAARTDVPATAGIAGFALAAAIALLLPVTSAAAYLVRSYPDELSAPISLPGLTGPIAPDPRWQPQFEGVAWAHRAGYIRPDGRVVELYRNEYHRQSQGKELISRGSPVFDPAAFMTRTSQVARIGIADSRSLEVTRLELRDRSGQKWLALYTYVIGDDVVASPRLAQFQTAVQSLYSRPAAGVLAMMMPCAPDCGSISDDLDAAMLAAGEAYRRARGE